MYPLLGIYFEQLKFIKATYPLDYRISYGSTEILNNDNTKDVINHGILLMDRLNID